MDYLYCSRIFFNISDINGKKLSNYLYNVPFINTIYNISVFASDNDTSKSINFAKKKETLSNKQMIKKKLCQLLLFLIFSP